MKKFEYIVGINFLGSTNDANNESTGEYILGRYECAQRQAYQEDQGAINTISKKQFVRIGFANFVPSLDYSLPETMNKDFFDLHKHLLNCLLPTFNINLRNSLNLTIPRRRAARAFRQVHPLRESEFRLEDKRIRLVSSYNFSSMGCYHPTWQNHGVFNNIFR